MTCINNQVLVYVHVFLIHYKEYLVNSKYNLTRSTPFNKYQEKIFEDKHKL